MKKGKWLFLLSMICIAIGFIWSVDIYFDNWEKIMSDKNKFDLYHKPVIVLIIGIVAYNFHSVFYEEN